MKYRILGSAVLFLSFHLYALAQGQGQRPNLNPGEGQAGGGRGRGGPVTPPRPTPHFPDGRVNFGQSQVKPVCGFRSMPVSLFLTPEWAVVPAPAPTH